MNVKLGDNIRGMLAVDARRLNVSADVGEMPESASESAVASPSVDVKGNRDPVRHRPLKTVCLYVSFGAIVRQLKIVTKLRFRHYLTSCCLLHAGVMS